MLLILNNIRDNIFFPFYTLNTSLQRYNSAYIVDLCFLALKYVLSNRLCFSTRYTILSVTSNLSAFPSVKRREISLQLFATVQSPYFSFYSSTIFTTFYSYSTFPILSDLVKKKKILLLSIGYSSRYTLAGRLSLLGVLFKLALNIATLTLYLVIGSYSNQLQLVVISSFYLYGSRTKKNTWSSSLVILWFSIITSPCPLAFLISSILINVDIACRLRYFNTFYILLLLLKNLF